MRAKKRIRDGKEHRYWSIVESCRNLDGRVVQRQVLYLGEINDSQKAAWCRTIDVLQTDSSAKQMALRIPVKPITESGVKPITESGQVDHLSERSDAGVRLCRSVIGLGQ